MTSGSDRLSLLAPLLGVCLAAGLVAQSTQTFVDAVDVNVVEVDVVVTDRKGRPVVDLGPEDFEIRVDGQPVEISNFHESRVFREPQASEGENRNGTAEPSEAPSDTDDTALTVVFYLDDANIYPAHRTRLLKRLEAALEPWRGLSANFMLARFENRLEVLVPPTADLDAIIEHAAGRPKGTARAVQAGEGAWRFAIRSLIDSHKLCHMTPFCRPCQDNWGELMSLARQYADSQATNVAVAVDGLGDLVTTLAGVPGKKAVVYVTNGLPQRPGISVFDYVGNRLCGDLRPSAPSEALMEMVQVDENSRFNRLAAHANANRVTLYGLDAAGLRPPVVDITLDDFALAPGAASVSLRAANAQSGLHLLASETGGKALVNANDLRILLDDVRKQLSASYSLGFVALDRKPGEIRQLRVALAPHAAKGRRIEYRRAYRDKSLDERLAERLLSVAYLGGSENPLDASIEFLGTRALAKKTHELSVAVAVPVEAILALPFRGEETGRLRLWMVAVEQDRGARTTVRQKELLLRDGDGAAADGPYRFDVAIRLPEGEYRIAVGVRDETTGGTALLAESVAVPIGSF